MRPRPLSLFVSTLALLAVAVASAACNGQGQGMVCDVSAGNGGNDDCQSPLTCQPAPGAVGSPNAYRCCPTDLTTATAPVCQLSTSVGDASPAPPAGDASGDDASGDAATGDAGDATVAETGSPALEASADAPVEGAAVEASADATPE
jgi:hypothetical protein